jgi:hypothetical protein
MEACFFFLRKGRLHYASTTWHQLAGPGPGRAETKTLKELTHSTERPVSSCRFLNGPHVESLDRIWRPGRGAPVSSVIACSAVSYPAHPSGPEEGRRMKRGSFVAISVSSECASPGKWPTGPWGQASSSPGPAGAVSLFGLACSGLICSLHDRIRA